MNLTAAGSGGAVIKQMHVLSLRWRNSYKVLQVSQSIDHEEAISDDEIEMRRQKRNDGLKLILIGHELISK